MHKRNDCHPLHTIGSGHKLLLTVMLTLLSQALCLPCPTNTTSSGSGEPLMDDESMDCSSPLSNLSLYREYEQLPNHYQTLMVNVTLKNLYHQKQFQDILNNIAPRSFVEFRRVDGNYTNDVCRYEVGVKQIPANDKYKCPWEYRCDYNPHRLPQLMWQASCTGLESGGTSRPVHYPVPVLYNKEACNPANSTDTWSLSYEKIAVACVCTDEEPPQYHYY